jgi:hypothetical protein
MNYMRFFACVGIFFGAYGFCDCEEKVYVQPNQISITPNAIFINILDRWFATETLCVDSGGVYVTSASKDGYAPLKWKCPYCGWIGGITDSYCKNPKCPGPRF